MTGAGATRAAPCPTERARAEPAGAWSRNPAVACLAVAVAVSAAMLIVLGAHVTLFADEWAVVLGRRATSVGAFLDPYNGHLTAAVVAFYKVMLAVFGMTSPIPFHVASALTYALAGVLLFAYARRRVGDWLALIGTVMILFFGAASVDMLSPFQTFFSGAIAAGLGALLALDRDDSRGDAIACLLLAVAVSFSEVGLAFSVGALVRIALSERPMAARLYVPLVPIGLYVIWWLGWGHTAPSEITLRNVANAPSYVLTAAGTAIGALAGLTSAGDQLPDPVGLDWAPILLVAAIGLAVWRVQRLGRVPRGVWPVLAIGLTFWILAAFNAGYVRPADNARYLYPSAVFVLLIVAELFRGVRVSAAAIALVAIGAALAIGSNLAFLSDSYKLFWKPGSETTRADLAGLEISGPDNPAFVLRSGLIDINAGEYLAAVAAWGSPAYSEADLAARPEGDRQSADKTMAAALGLALTPGGAVSGPCRPVGATPAGSPAVELAPGTTTLKAAAGAKAKVALGRFASDLPVGLGFLAPRSRASLTIPADRSSRPWHLGLVGRGHVELCTPRL